MSIRAHVIGCPKALGVPVDICECGGRDFTPGEAMSARDEPIAKLAEEHKRNIVSGVVSSKHNALETALLDFGRAITALQAEKDAQIVEGFYAQPVDCALVERIVAALRAGESPCGPLVKEQG